MKISFRRLLPGDIVMVDANPNSLWNQAALYIHHSLEVISIEQYSARVFDKNTNFEFNVSDINYPFHFISRPSDPSYMPYSGGLNVGDEVLIVGPADPSQNILGGGGSEKEPIVGWFIDGNAGKRDKNAAVSDLYQNGNIAVKFTVSSYESYYRQEWLKLVKKSTPQQSDSVATSPRPFTTYIINVSTHLGKGYSRAEIIKRETERAIREINSKVRTTMREWPPGKQLSYRAQDTHIDFYWEEDPNAP